VCIFVVVSLDDSAAPNDLYDDDGDDEGMGEGGGEGGGLMIDAVPW